MERDYPRPFTFEKQVATLLTDVLPKEEYNIYTDKESNILDKRIKLHPVSKKR